MAGDFELGQHDARIESLERHIEALQTQIEVLSKTVGELNALLQQARGGWKVILLVASLGTAAGITLAKVWGFIGTVATTK